MYTYFVYLSITGYLQSLSDHLLMPEQHLLVSFMKLTLLCLIMIWITFSILMKMSLRYVTTLWSDPHLQFLSFAFRKDGLGGGLSDVVGFFSPLFFKCW